MRREYRQFEYLLTVARLAAINMDIILILSAFVAGALFYHWLIGQAGFVGRFVQGRIESFAKKKSKKALRKLTEAVLNKPEPIERDMQKRRREANR